MGNGGRVSILPQNSTPIGVMTLGHLAEGNGEHYICLEPDNDNNFMSEEDEENVETNEEGPWDNIQSNQENEENYESTGSSQNVQIETINEIGGINDVEEQADEPKNFLQMLPLEILEKIFVFALTSSDFRFPTHVCWTLKNMLKAIPFFQPFEKIGIGHLPRIYIGDDSYLPKASKSGEITVNAQRLIRSFGSGSGLISELKRIVLSTKWNTAWFLLLAEAYGWYVVKDIFWKGKKRN